VIPALERLAISAARAARLGAHVRRFMSEYRALRACVLRLWRDESDPDGFAKGAEEITRFTEAIDQVVAEMVLIYEQREAQYRDRFLGILGHDLRNPLNSISLSATSLAGAKQLNEKQVGAVSRILRSMRRLDYIVNDLLDFARGRLVSPMAINPVETNLGTVVREVADEVQSANPGFSVDVDMDGDLSGDWDTERLKQLLSNLLLNAIQHGSGKNVAVTAKRAENLVLLQVCNEGPPIPKELLGTMVDPLFHGRSSDPNSKGLGLGLFIVKEIVSAHRGTIADDLFKRCGNRFLGEPPSSFTLS